jgi:hypothetical protein
VSARATHLKAATENVFVTTIERKQMSNKTSFKRIALAVVAALGFGVLASGPSSAVIDETLTLSASSATVTAFETATVTVTLSFISEAALESRTVAVVQSADPLYDGSNGVFLLASTTDSQSVVNHAVGSRISALVGDSVGASTAGAFVRANWTLQFAAPTAAGTYTYTVSTRGGAGANVGTSGQAGVIGKTAVFTLTVTAGSGTTTPDATKSLMWLNGAEPTIAVARPTRADSTLAVSAGLATDPQAVAYIFPELKNTADTVVATSGSAVDGNLVLIVSGPGLLTLKNKEGSAETARSKSVTATAGDTVTVYSDGTAGVATITGSISGVNLTQAAKTLTFSGKPASFAVTLDSQSVVASTTAVRSISFTAKDSTGNAITSATQGASGSFYAISADTKIVGSNTSAASSACSWQAAMAKFTCDLVARESGTTTITIADSTTVASSLVTSTAETIYVVGSAYRGSITFDKTTYLPGEKAIITLRYSDGGDRPVINGAHSSVFASGAWAANEPTFTGDFTSVANFLAGTSFSRGVDTAVVYMPANAGTYSWTATTAGTLKEPVSFSFSVTNPAEDAANSALDAAQEATDAAIAATDAAILAQEAADEAASAAVAAQETAQAAVDAVTALSAEVTKLVALTS